MSEMLLRPQSTVACTAAVGLSVAGFGSGSALATVLTPMRSAQCFCASTPYKRVQVVEQSFVNHRIFETHAVWSDLRNDLRRWRTLAAGWDGADSIPPRPEVLELGQAFLTHFETMGIAPPESYIAADGEIGYRWVKDGRVASVAFPEDRHIVAYVERRNSAPMELDHQARPPSMYFELTSALLGNF